MSDIIEQKAIVDRNGAVLDDHGTTLIFGSEKAARQYLQPHIKDYLKQQHGRTWLAPYKETRTSITQAPYASGKGEEIK